MGHVFTLARISAGSRGPRVRVKNQKICGGRQYLPVENIPARQKLCSQAPINKNIYKYKIKKK